MVSASAKIGAESLDLTTSRPLTENLKRAFKGNEKGGPFEIPYTLACQWLALPSNPNGRTNCDVVKPWVNGIDITRRHSDTWIVDFGVDMDYADATLYEAPFQYIIDKVKPARMGNKEASRVENGGYMVGQDQKCVMLYLRFLDT